MKDLMAQIRADPSPGNCAIAGMLLAAVAGAIAGLVVGLHVRPATAWAAMFELGVPAAILGAAAGAVIGWVLTLARGCRRHRSA